MFGVASAGSHHRRSDSKDGLDSTHFHVELRSLIAPWVTIIGLERRPKIHLGSCLGLSTIGSV